MRRYLLLLLLLVFYDFWTISLGDLQGWNNNLQIAICRHLCSYTDIHANYQYQCSQRKCFAALKIGFALVCCCCCCCFCCFFFQFHFQMLLNAFHKYESRRLNMEMPLPGCVLMNACIAMNFRKEKQRKVVATTHTHRKWKKNYYCYLPFAQFV